MTRKKTKGTSTRPQKSQKAGHASVAGRLKEKSKSKKPATKPAGKKTASSKTAAKKKKLSFREVKLLEIKKKLANQKGAILAEAEEALNSLPGQTIFPDMSDQATAETDRSFMLRLRSREQKLLKKIEDAIERIEGGTFGICEECGMEIDLRRLEARPVTTLCIDCKTQQEEEEKLRE